MRVPPWALAAPSSNVRSLSCCAAGTYAVPQQPFCCERNQRETGTSATGSLELFAARCLNGSSRANLRLYSVLQWPPFSWWQGAVAITQPRGGSRSRFPGRATLEDC